MTEARRSISLAMAFAAACHAPPSPVDATPPDAAAAGHATLTATVDSTRFITREHMLASAEMQTSGEPLAEAMGRALGVYSRDLLPTDIYLDPSSGAFWIDLTGFSTAVESYEYSKQPMNMLAFEAGAGTPLADLVGDVAPLAQHYAQTSNALGKWVFPAGTWPTGNAFGDLNPTGVGSGAANPIGWPGMAPTAHVYASFDPTIDPTSAADLQCSIASDDNPSEGGLPLVGADYECDATTLHVRAPEPGPTIAPGADGFASWKYSLWTINYLQSMHDDANTAVATVDEATLANVGTPGWPIHLGSSDIEGFQAAMFVTMLDARADDWLLHLTTTDGATLSGFASLADALAYDYARPARWFPGAVAVGSGSDAIAAAQPEVLDLLGVALGYATAYALTDTANADVGGSQPARAYFDGDPFPADDQIANGDPTLHDRALAMIRVAVIDLDRQHAIGDLFVDGTTIATTTAAYAVLALRAVRRSLTSQLELYSNETPDTAATATPLDALPLNDPADPTLVFGARVDQLLRAHAALLYNGVTDATGRVYAGWDAAANAPVDTGDSLEAYAAAIRGLFAGYLATGDASYRDRAEAVYARLEALFYDPDARIYAMTPAPTDTITYTPLAFALLQSALRDMYELVAIRPGGEALEPVLEDRIARLDKLVLNGWDDRNRDKHVDWPDECVDVIDGLPRGGLQMAERTLTGEVGRLRDEGGGSGGPPTSDRDSDCVPEIDDAHLPAALAASITFHVTRAP